MSQNVALVAALVGASIAQSVCAGEIAGLPPHVDPQLRPDYHLYLGNDILAGSANDDFRTQQIIATARFGQRWLAVVDHSILTRNNSMTPQRIDTMTASVGYEILSRTGGDVHSTVAAGLGVRSVGDFAGSRIQNGFHRIVDSDIVRASYADTRQTDPAAWFVAEHRRTFRPAPGKAGILGKWDLGAWGRAAALTTADGQTDAVLSANLVASRRHYDLWIGVRQDWRRGYTADLVQLDTAAEEEKLAFNIGVRFGSLVLETVQRIDSKASYGQLSFVSSAATRGERHYDDDSTDLQFALHFPHMLLQLAGRWPVDWFVSPQSPWREAAMVDFRTGQPQLGNDTSRYVETNQLSFNLEWSRPLREATDWLRFYGGIGTGIRTERLIGRGELSGQRAERITRGVLVGDIGLEVLATGIGERLSHTLRLGVTGWLPSSSATVTIGADTSEIQRPGVSVVAAWTLSY